MLLWLVLTTFPAGTAQAQAPDTAPTVPLQFTHEHRLTSAINGREYIISVALPYAYVEGHQDRVRYPSMYLLDGEVEFPLFTSMFRLSNRGARNNVFLIGVGYPPGARPGFPPPADGRPAYRAIDYTPPPARDSLMIEDTGGRQRGSIRLEDGTLRYGGAPAFLRVLREEIIPFVEARYPVSDDRALHGHSFGGLFTAYALFEDPDLFKRYAITSPSLWWDAGSLIEREPEFARAHPKLDKEIFLSIGSEEIPAMASVMWELARSLCWSYAAGQYQGLKLTIETVPDELHSTAVPFSRVLKTFYPPADGGPTAPSTAWVCDH